MDGKDNRDTQPHAKIDRAKEQNDEAESVETIDYRASGDLSPPSDRDAEIPSHIPDAASQLVSVDTVDDRDIFGRLASGSGSGNADLTEDSTQPQVMPLSSDAAQIAAEAKAGLRYKKIKPFGKGKFGEVFMARDLELGRIVALKTEQNRAGIRPDRSRFTTEAVITGALEHPGIVPIYGLGRHDNGQKFYAMRFISGTSFQSAIDTFHRIKNEGLAVPYYSREFKSLLRKFIDVCQAIHYAHEHGILHRDIKPDNIMVGEYGETMVVDWGMAKVLADRPEQKFATHDNPVLKAIPTETLDGQVMGTPIYMSPEQAMGNNESLDSRSDIYSLGATLFTLLSGQRSVEGSSTLEVIENVRKGRVRSLDTIAPSAPRALASIVAKSMNSRCEDRYANVGLMVEDIERWLADERVLAHQGLESIGERMGRWVRRHHTWVVAGGMFFAAFLMIAIAAAVLINQARQQAEVARVEALERYRQSRVAIDTWLVGSTEASQYFPGTQSIRMRMLELAADDYSRLASSPSRDPDLELERARAMIRLGEIRQVQGRFADSIERYQEAVHVLKGIPRSSSINHLALAESAHADTRLGIVFMRENRWGDAQEKFQQSIEVLSRLMDQHPQDSSIDQYLIAALVNSAEASLEINNFVSAVEALESAIKRCDRLMHDETMSDFVRSDAALAGAKGRELLGRAYQIQGKYDDADAVLQKSIDVLTRASSDQSDDPRLLDALASALISRSIWQRAIGDQNQLERSLNDAAEHYRTLIIAMPDVPTYKVGLVIAYTNLGMAQLDDERPDDANETLSEARQLLKELRFLYPDVAEYEERYAVCDDAMSQIALERDEDGDLALDLAAGAIGTYLSFEETFDNRYRLAIARSHAAHAFVTIDAKKRTESSSSDQSQSIGPVDVPEQAQQLLEYAISDLRLLESQQPDVPDYRYTLGHVIYRYGLLVAAAGQTERARDLFSETIELWGLTSKAGHAESADHLAILLATCPVVEIQSPQAALAASKLAIATSPTNLRYQLTHAVSLALNGDYKAAEAALGAIRDARGEWAPRDHWGRAILGKLTSSNEFEEQRAMAETTLKMHPGSPRLLALKGLLEQLEQKPD